MDEAQKQGEFTRDIIVLATSDETVREGKTFIEIDIRIPRNLIYFKGHFKGNPVLPGVVQLNHVVLANIERLWPDLGHLSSMKRLKFIRIIHPDDHIRLSLERVGESQKVLFKIIKDNECATSGILLFAPEER